MGRTFGAHVTVAMTVGIDVVSALRRRVIPNPVTVMMVAGLGVPELKNENALAHLSGAVANTKGAQRAILYPGYQLSPNLSRDTAIHASRDIVYPGISTVDSRNR